MGAAVRDSNLLDAFEECRSVVGRQFVDAVDHDRKHSIAEVLHNQVAAGSESDSVEGAGNQLLDAPCARSRAGIHRKHAIPEAFKGGQACVGLPAAWWSNEKNPRPRRDQLQEGSRAGRLTPCPDQCKSLGYPKGRSATPSDFREKPKQSRSGNCCRPRYLVMIRQDWMGT
jgi:hypothetical protein